MARPEHGQERCLGKSAAEASECGTGRDGNWRGAGDRLGGRKGSRDGVPSLRPGKSFVLREGPLLALYLPPARPASCARASALPCLSAGSRGLAGPGACWGLRGRHSPRGWAPGPCAASSSLCVGAEHGPAGPPSPSARRRVLPGAASHPARSGNASGRPAETRMTRGLGPRGPSSADSCGRQRRPAPCPPPPPRAFAWHRGHCPRGLGDGQFPRVTANT